MQISESNPKIEAVNLLQAFAQVQGNWHPKVLGRVNDQYVKIARIEGEFVWHSHADEDELFYVIRGSMRMDLDGRSIDLREGDFLVVPKGVQHRPVAERECLIMLIETDTTLHTGDEITELTVNIADQI